MLRKDLIFSSIFLSISFIVFVYSLTLYLMLPDLPSLINTCFGFLMLLLALTYHLIRSKDYLGRNKGMVATNLVSSYLPSFSFRPLVSNRVYISR